MSLESIPLSVSVIKEFLLLEFESHSYMETPLLKLQKDAIYEKLNEEVINNCRHHRESLISFFFVFYFFIIISILVWYGSSFSHGQSLLQFGILLFICSLFMTVFLSAVWLNYVQSIPENLSLVFQMNTIAWFSASFIFLFNEYFFMGGCILFCSLFFIFHCMSLCPDDSELIRFFIYLATRIFNHYVSIQLGLLTILFIQTCWLVLWLFGIVGYICMEEHYWTVTLILSLSFFYFNEVFKQTSFLMGALFTKQWFEGNFRNQMNIRGFIFEKMENIFINSFFLTINLILQQFQVMLFYINIKFFSSCLTNMIFLTCNSFGFSLIGMGPYFFFNIREITKEMMTHEVFIRYMMEDRVGFFCYCLSFVNALIMSCPTAYFLWKDENVLFYSSLCFMIVFSLTGTSFAVLHGICSSIFSLWVSHPITLFEKHKKESNVFVKITRKYDLHPKYYGAFIKLLPLEVKVDTTT